MAINFNGTVGANAMTVQRALALLRGATPVGQSAHILLGEEHAQSTTAAPITAGSTAPQFHPQPQMLSSVQMLLALSSLNPLEARRKQRIANARRGLEALEQLHTELLEGAVGPKTLDRLVEWLRDDRVGDKAADTGLKKTDKDERSFAGLMDEIELRVRVELAKFNIEV